MIFAKFMTSNHFKTEPYWHLTPNATKEEKAEFEDVINSPLMRDTLYERYPNMRLPYGFWDGTAEDRSTDMSDDEVKLARAATNMIE